MLRTRSETSIRRRPVRGIQRKTIAPSQASTQSGGDVELPQDEDVAYLSCEVPNPAWRAIGAPSEGRALPLAIRRRGEQADPSGVTAVPDTRRPTLERSSGRSGTSQACRVLTRQPKRPAKARQQTSSPKRNRQRSVPPETTSNQESKGVPQDQQPPRPLIPSPSHPSPPRKRGPIPPRRRTGRRAKATAIAPPPSFRRKPESMPRRHGTSPGPDLPAVPYAP